MDHSMRFSLGSRIAVKATGKLGTIIRACAMDVYVIRVDGDPVAVILNASEITLVAR